MSVQTNGSCSCRSGPRLDHDPDSNGLAHVNWNVFVRVPVGKDELLESIKGLDYSSGV